MNKKIVSTVLAAVMVTTICPMAALADGGREMHPLISPNPNLVIAPNPNTVIGPNENPVISQQPLTDIDESYWAYTEIKEMLDKGYILSYGANTFAPNETFTREAFVNTLWKISGSPVVNYALNYTDIKENGISTEAIRWATSEGIVQGVGGNLFAPNNGITLEEAATMMYNYVNKFDMGFKGQWMFRLAFNDAKDISEWAYEPICWTVVSKIITGESEDVLNPTSIVKRDKAAVLFSRLLKEAEKSKVDFSKYTEVVKENAEKTEVPNEKLEKEDAKTE